MHSRTKIRLINLFALLAILAILVFAACAGERPVVRVSRPEIRIDAKLYEATLDCERHMLSSILFRVCPEDVIRPVPAELDRDWWTTKATGAYALESGDYRNSKFERGHVRPLLLSGGSPHWQEINFLPVIVPQYPLVNDPLISGLEEHIADLAEHDPVEVRVIVEFGDHGRDQLPHADEPYEIPSAFVYELSRRINAEITTVVTTVRIPNVEHPPSLDWRSYLVEPTPAK